MRPAPASVRAGKGGANPYDGGSLTAEQSIPTTAFLGFLQRQTSESVAGFFQGTYRIIPELRLTGGFRFTADSTPSERSANLALVAPISPNSEIPADVVIDRAPNEQLSGHNPKEQSTASIAPQPRWRAPDLSWSPPPSSATSIAGEALP